MVEFVNAAGTTEIQSGQMKMVIVDGQEILLARAGDAYYAADNRCPHIAGNLSMGVLNGTIVTCPMHRSQFDLTDGHVVRWTDWTGVKLSLAKMIKSPRPLKTYAVKVVGDRILIESGKVPANPGQEG